MVADSAKGPTRMQLTRMIVLTRCIAARPMG
jgi:hypothetical protein